MWHDTWHASKCNLLDLFTTLFTSFVPKDISQLIIFFLKNQFYLFIYFWLRWVFIAAHGLSLVAASGSYSSLQSMGFSLRWLLSLRSTGSRHTGFSSCDTQAQ